MGQIFKNGSSKYCGRQPLKNLKEYGLLKQIIFLQIFKSCLPRISLGPFLALHETLMETLSFIYSFDPESNGQNIISLKMRKFQSNNSAFFLTAMNCY